VISSKCGTEKENVGFDVFIAMAMKRTFFWDVRPCSPAEISRSFVGTFCLLS
jgi:hypothetical protein